MMLLKTASIWNFSSAVAVTVLLALSGCQRPEPEVSPKPPNIIFIIADDLGWEDTGAYGHPTIRTPNIDQLAQEGMRFENAILTISSCSPSRSSMITGRYPHSTDAEQLHWPLPAEQITFPERLMQAGYWTAAVGKWHLGDAVRDRFNKVVEASVSGFQLPTGNAAQQGKFVETVEGDSRSGCADWVPTLQGIPDDQPYFLWLAAIDPHRDYQEDAIEDRYGPEDAVVPPYIPDTPEIRRDLALYYDEITRLDKYVGEVIREVDRRGERDRTFILFISDNGRPFPRDKTSLYDGGIKAPWIARWPGQITAGSTSSGLVSAVDVAPTLLEIAGVDSPETFQGKSFLPLLKGSEEPIRTYAFAEHNWHDFEDRGRAVRSVRFKYIRNYYSDLPGTPPADVVRSPSFIEMRRLRDAGQLQPNQLGCFLSPRPEEELYDVTQDPYEMNNLAGEKDYQQTLEEMRTALAGWEAETGDTLPAERTLDEFDREEGNPLPNRIRPRPSKQEMFGTKSTQ